MTIDVTGSNKERFEKNIRRKEKLTTYLYDMSKATFSIMVLADVAVWITKGFSMDVMCSAVFGSFASFLFAYCANRVMKY